MEHRKIKELISSYFDGMLEETQKKAVEEHLKACQACRKEFEEMKAFEEVMAKMEFRKPKKEMWEVYWASVYNRLERKLGWILLSIGGMILLFFGGFKAVEGLLRDPSVPLILKVGILTALAGAVVLLVSLLKEQVFVRRRERYKEVEK